ncbi:MAG: hypothetical protein M0P70_04520 [Desulfobulbaceae bacterium]|nr:hypothetical protein [Desulfobulbaceae bacterium]
MKIESTSYQKRMEFFSATTDCCRRMHMHSDLSEVILKTLGNLRPVA